MGQLLQAFEIFDRSWQLSNLVVVEIQSLKSEQRIKEVLRDVLYFILLDAERKEFGESLQLVRDFFEFVVVQRYCP